MAVSIIAETDRNPLRRYAALVNFHIRVGTTELVLLDPAGEAVAREIAPTAATAVDRCHGG